MRLVRMPDRIAPLRRRMVQAAKASALAAAEIERLRVANGALRGPVTTRLTVRPVMFRDLTQTRPCVGPFSSSESALPFFPTVSGGGGTPLLSWLWAPLLASLQLTIEGINLHFDNIQASRLPRETASRRSSDHSARHHLTARLPVRRLCRSSPGLRSPSALSASS